jgi:ElaB/YqjD/DUF883 family membrane-anchored ribosome-binding protein
MTEIDPSTGQSIPAPRRNGSGASARPEEPSLGESLDEAKGELKAKAQEARANLKAKAEEARAAASERLAQAKSKASELATTAQQKASEGGKAAVAHVRAHPVRSALIAGAAAGVAVGVVMALRQNHTRKLAARTAKSFWRDYGKILLPLATALAVPAKAAQDAAPGLMAKGAKIAKAMPDRLSRVLH